jgi:oligopeptide transport system ATP-binding protein
VSAPVAAAAPPLLTIRGLMMHFPADRGGVIRAVDGVDLDIAAGETLGLVGESGCGKSTLGRCLLRLYKPTAGTIEYDGRNLARLSSREMRPYRRHLQMIFQDPYASLNPRMTVEDLVAEPLEIHRMGPSRGVRRRVQELMQLVGLDPRYIRRYPHEFSGGQRQRIGIARALALEPRLLVADEPISALDVSIQAQILNLMVEIQGRLGLAMLFISHDLSAVRHISRRVAVMYLGRIVETAPAEVLYSAPRHPYTVSLLSAAPVPDPVAARVKPVILRGDVPSPLNPPKACRFHTRCPMVQDICRVEDPPLREVTPGQWSACHFAEQVPEVMGVHV